MIQMFVNESESLRLNMFEIMQMLKNLYHSQDKIFDVENKCCLKCNNEIAL